MLIENEKIFYNPGELVKVKQLNNSPVMYVVEKVSRSYMNDQKKENIFIGIKCRWFDVNMQLQEAIFSTKDLIHV